MTPEGVSPEPEPAQPAEEIAEAVVEARETLEADETREENATISMEELMGSGDAALDEAPAVSQEDSQVKAVIEAIIYVADEPLTLMQIAASLQLSAERVGALLSELVAEFDRPGHGIAIREVAGGYKMATKAEHHEAVRNFVKSLKAPLKLSLPALETLAVIAYKQPATGPEILDIRGVQGGGVFKTLLDRKLIAVAGRKNVLGRPILYKTTKEFLIQFGLKDLSELPSLKEFEEIRRMAFADSEPPAGETVPDAEPDGNTELDFDATIEPAVQPAIEPAVEPAIEPAVEPAIEPAAEALPEAVSEAEPEVPPASTKARAEAAPQSEEN